NPLPGASTCPPPPSVTGTSSTRTPPTWRRRSARWTRCSSPTGWPAACRPTATLWCGAAGDGGAGDVPAGGDGTAAGGGGGEGGAGGGGRRNPNTPGTRAGGGAPCPTLQTTPPRPAR